MEWSFAVASLDSASEYAEDEYEESENAVTAKAHSVFFFPFFLFIF